MLWSSKQNQKLSTYSFCRVSLCIVVDPPLGEKLSSVTKWKKADKTG